MALARLIYDSSEKNADLYYVTKFRAPDPFIYLEVGGRRIMVMNDLEIDRAKKQATVHQVLSLTPFVEAAQKRNKKPVAADILVEVLRSKRVKKLEAPASTSFALVDDLRKRGITVKSGGTPFYAKRLIKTADEARYITQSQRAVFSAMQLAEDILRASRVRGGKLYLRGHVLTSELLRKTLDVFLLEQGYIASETIISCGKHAVDPHDVGSGPLKPNTAIIVDIFPRSIKTLYYGDATRTFCKGRAPEALRKLYATVKRGQAMGIKSLKSGIDGFKIHSSILNYFKEHGYPTGEKDGRMQGFFHSTGHGIGLELHENPTRIGPAKNIVKAGNVVSIEPGLYYKGIGGVRIEDLVYVTKGGCRVLGRFPKRLEIR